MIRAPFLIAEIGNNHFGSVSEAKILIRLAKESGADAVKFQAIVADELLGGSMPKEFYKQCELRFDEYESLIAYGDMKGVHVFFSIFSESLEGLFSKEKYHKFAASQTRTLNPSLYDFVGSFVSFGQDHVPETALKFCTPMYATDYLTDEPKLDGIPNLSFQSNRPTGYSDHTMGIMNCVRAWSEQGAVAIEKHFTIDKNVKIMGQLFRDTVHGATPQEFENLARIVKG